MRALLLLFALTILPAQDRHLKVAAVQFRSVFDLTVNRDAIVERLEKLAARGVEVAVFPECALTGYRTQGSYAESAEAIAAAEETIRQACRRHKIAAVVGSIHKVNGKTFNTAIVIDRDGELVERYGKVMLAGEKWATPGNHIAYFELAGIPSTVIICHDERYPELVRLPAIQGARIVYYISHESGMAQESKLAPYRAQLMARAVENNVAIVAANAPANLKDNSGSHGQSRIVAADGNVLDEASLYGDDVLVRTLTIKPGRLERPLKELNADWWQAGVERMMAQRRRPLE